ncbi:hypothetical protein MASR1M46_14390 [Bacteroidales bacterium]
MRRVKALLAKSVNPNTKIHNETILAISINGQFPEITTLLINAKGIKLNEWNILLSLNAPEIAALMLSIHNKEISKILIDKGATLDTRTKHGETALML